MEKKAQGIFLSTATFFAIDSANVVFPVLPRPAITITSEGFSPPVTISTEENPVLIVSVSILGVFVFISSSNQFALLLHFAYNDVGSIRFLTVLFAPILIEGTGIKHHTVIVVFVANLQILFYIQHRLYRYK